MFFKKKRTGNTDKPDQATQAAASPEAPPQSGSLLATEKITLRDSTDAPKPVGRKFPGPRSADAALRVAVERRAYAELISHAKESLEAEVCGVLAGQVCVDDEGIFVHVEAVIRGAAATEASTHVTFTQSTWNAIHKTLEHDFPKLKIVGWYHTHPGFGVEFSDMDLFIQKNFFSGPAQIALVTDPMNGAVAICVNTPEGARYLPRFWVDGREQTSRVPARLKGDLDPGGDSPDSDTVAAIHNLEARVNQLVQVIDEQRASYYRFLLFCGVVFCLGIIGSIGYQIYSQFLSRVEPPRNISFAPVPVQIGNENVLLGVSVVKWDLPPELDPLTRAVEQMKKEFQKELEDEVKKAADKQSDAKSAPSAASPASSMQPQTQNTPTSP